VEDNGLACKTTSPYRDFAGDNDRFPTNSLLEWSLIFLISNLLNLIFSGHVMLVISHYCYFAVINMAEHWQYVHKLYFYINDTSMLSASDKEMKSVIMIQSVPELLLTTWHKNLHERCASEWDNQTLHTQYEMKRMEDLAQDLNSCNKTSSLQVITDTFAT